MSLLSRQVPNLVLLAGDDASPECDDADPRETRLGGAGAQKGPIADTEDPDETSPEDDEPGSELSETQSTATEAQGVVLPTE